MTPRRHLVIGLHGSGKTTFIAALWHVVIAEELQSALRLHKLDGDRTHLNKLREAWLQCQPVPRTSQQAEAHVRMLLTDKDGRIFEVWFPDMSGESFRNHWKDRQWPTAYDELVENANSVLLFVHPGKIIEPTRIATMNSIARGLDGNGATAADTTASLVPWDAEKSPTQVQLVELLQLLQWRVPAREWNVTTVISAWDLVGSTGHTPQEWLGKRLPLLGQYLRSNGGRLRASYCGVSAQGGGLPSEAARLKAVSHASNRIKIVREGHADTNDITVVISDIEQLGAS